MLLKYPNSECYIELLAFHFLLAWRTSWFPGSKPLWNAHTQCSAPACRPPGASYPGWRGLLAEAVAGLPLRASQLQRCVWPRRVRPPLAEPQGQVLQGLSAQHSVATMWLLCLPSCRTRLPCIPSEEAAPDLEVRRMQVG